MGDYQYPPETIPVLRPKVNTEPVQNGDALLKEFGQASQPAADVPPPPEPNLNADQGQEPPKPDFIFVKDEDPAKPKEYEPDEEAIDVGFEVGLNLIDWVQSELSSVVTGNNAEAYQLTEVEKQWLIKTWVPIIQKNGGKINPMWIASIVTGFIVIKKGAVVYRDARANKRNKKAIQGNGEALANVVKEASTTASRKKRTRFDIKDDGRYNYARNGTTYIKKDEPGEKVDLSNLDEVKEVIQKNGWPKLQKAFNLPDSWAADQGLDLDQIEADKWE